MFVYHILYYVCLSYLLLCAQCVSLSIKSKHYKKTYVLVKYILVKLDI